MDNTDYQILKNKILLQPTAYKEFDKNEIVAVDETHYRLGDATVELSPKISENIDSFIGLKTGQSKLAEDSYGGSGLANLRNFFAQAKQNKKEKIIVVADTETRKITGIYRTKTHFIPPQAFFEFAEMVMDQNQFEPEAIDYGDGSDISIRMKSLNPQVMSFTKDDDFISNGLWLKWNPAEIAFGNYYERIICRNGMTQISKNKQMSLYSLQDENKIRLLLGNHETFLRQNLQLMLRNAKKAITTQASVRELGTGTKMLEKLGVDQKLITDLIPYDKNVARYEESGYPVDTEGLAAAVSSMTVWQLFNILTAFATHNKIWSEHDIRRTLLMTRSIDFLNRKRDIKQHYNIYE